jgi:3,4-dihydroxy 2-butanone 4-phosphate synthase/GTP cyclohydrolase II
MKDDGTMARLPDLEVFAREHGLKIGTIADLIGYRSRNESLVQRAGQRPLLTPHGEFECSVWRDHGGGVHLSLSKGRWGPGDDVLVRVHEPFTVVDLLDTAAVGHSWPLGRALQALQASERGVAVLLNCSQDADTLLQQLSRSSTEAPQARGQIDLRTYGVGAQILRELGVRRMKLLGSPRRMPSMVGYGLEVTGFVAV